MTRTLEQLMGIPAGDFAPSGLRQPPTPSPAQALAAKRRRRKKHKPRPSY
jgi:hypothetical protein